MDTKEFFAKAKKDVSSMLSKAANKTEFLAKLSKHKLDITNYQAKIKSVYKKIGDYIYSNKEQFSQDEFLGDCFEHIEELNKKIAEAQESIDTIKEEHKKLRVSSKKTEEKSEKTE